MAITDSMVLLTNDDVSPKSLISTRPHLSCAEGPGRGRWPELKVVPNKYDKFELQAYKYNRIKNINAQNIFYVLNTSMCSEQVIRKKFTITTYSYGI